MANKHMFPGSISLVHCDYNEDEKRMEICFASGSTYHYDKVPKSVYEALKAAESPGKHFHTAIRTKYKGKVKKEG